MSLPAEHRACYCPVGLVWTASAVPMALPSQQQHRPRRQFYHRHRAVRRDLDLDLWLLRRGRNGQECIGRSRIRGRLCGNCCLGDILRFDLVGGHHLDAFECTTIAAWCRPHPTSTQLLAAPVCGVCGVCGVCFGPPCAANYDFRAYFTICSSGKSHLCTRRALKQTPQNPQNPQHTPFMSSSEHGRSWFLSAHLSRSSGSACGPRLSQVRRHGA